MKQAAVRALMIIGDMAADYAADLTPTNTGALKNSFDKNVDEDKLTVSVGSGLFYAPYVELGTGRLYESPPEWIAFQAQKGRGLDKWFYQDDKGEWHVGYPRTGVKMLQRAMKEHMDEYKTIIQTELGSI